MKERDWFSVDRHDLQGTGFFVKPGVRGHPDLPPGSEAIRKLPLAGTGSVLDLTSSAGLGALQALAAGATAAVLEASAAALHCAGLTLTGTGATVSAGILASEQAAQADTILLLPAADRGTARVELEIHSAAAALPPGGRLLLIGHKDQGGKRYEKLAAKLFSSTEVIRRESGWRVLDCRDAHTGVSEVPEVTEFTAVGLELRAFKGTYAAGKLDPGTAQLLAAIPDGDWLEGQRVLDLGCGYGLLALTAALAGGQVTALDDDLGAVRSTAGNAIRLGLGDHVQAVHSDLDSALPGDEGFDTVLMNPPFHVGRGVRLDVSRAFVDTAWRRLRPGGELWLVANRALPYERLLTSWRNVRQMRLEAGFKVLRAVR